jgi:isoamylase
MLLSKGSTEPLGLSFQEDRANFALYSAHATAVFMGIFFDGQCVEYPLYRTGSIWHISLSGYPREARYALRCEGPYDPEKGILFDASKWLGDPYAKSIPQKIKPEEPFDWQGITSPNIPKIELIIYEMHLSGFTKDRSSQVAFPGTYIGMIEKIPYLKELGVNAVELLPIFEFEAFTRLLHPNTGNPLPNYWGYQPLYYFAPMHTFAHQDPVREFKTLVRELHRNGIEVILDVVYNHTGEGKEKDHFIHFRGIDNTTYYMVDEKGNYRDFAGCGNTFNSNHPVPQQLILDSLRYWAETMHVDGFRFDLTSCLTRDQEGHPLIPSPLLQAISEDPILQKKKLIAEAWDAAGLYQVGHFPKTYPSAQWSEWNGPYRDTIRRFLRGNPGHAGLFANAITGSASIYASPASSINFITAHDGFSLNDLVTYEHKHNEENGEKNRDGADHNDSWNCGIEGPTLNRGICELRERQIRNFLLALFVSQGIPMLLMGDEYLHTRKGNNNPYVQDNETNWFLWDELRAKGEVFEFVKALIAFRKSHSQLHYTRELTNDEIEWHGEIPHHPNWENHSHLVAFTLKGEENFFCAFNAGNSPITLTLPNHKNWHEWLDTAKGWKTNTREKLPGQIELASHSAILAIQM